MRYLKIAAAVGIIGSSVFFCGEKVDPMIGIGPVKKVEIAATIDTKMAEDGKTIFQMKCSACHDIGERKVGPAIHGVTQRRKPEWIMNMILNPTEMTQKDPQAMELLATYMSQMTFQNVSQEETRKILEYFRDVDSKPATSGSEDNKKAP